jgi:hypothetical protein
VLKKEFLELLEKDEEFRLAVAGLLGLREILEELRKLRRDFEEYVKQNEERWGKFFEEWERRWEQNRKLWEENEKRWQENMKRWEENERRWEENERRWRENDKKWEEQFRYNRWIMSALSDIRDALGGGFEYYTARVVKLLLKERGFDCDVKANVTLPVDGFKEIDVICFNPLVVGEATVRLRSVEEAEGQLEKLAASVQAAEKFAGKKAYMKVLAVEYIDQGVADYLRKRAEELGVFLILGREIEA